MGLLNGGPLPDGPILFSSALIDSRLDAGHAMSRDIAGLSDFESAQVEKESSYPPDQTLKYEPLAPCKLFERPSIIPVEDPPPYTNIESDRGREEMKSKRSPGVKAVDADPRFALSRSGPLLTSIKELVAVRDKVVEKRIDMAIHESNYVAQWKHTSPHLDGLLASATALMSDVKRLCATADGSQLEEAFNRFQRSATHLQKWQREGNKAQQELTNWEGFLSSKEEDVYKEFRQMVAPPVIPSSVSTEEERSLNPEQFSQSSGLSDPLEHDYYDKMGELHLIRERIYNTDAEKRGRHLQREFELKNGDFVATSSERQTYEDYIRARENLLRKYFDTKQEMEALKQLCEDRGLGVASPNLPPMLDLSRSVERPPAILAVESLKISNKWNPDMWLLFGGLDKRHRVLQWRDNVNKAMGAPMKTAAIVPVQAPKSVDAIPGTPKHKRSGFMPSTEVSPMNISDPLDHEEVADDGASLIFDDARAGNPTSRRYSEPDTSELFRKFVLTTQSLMGITAAKSEGALDTNDLPLPDDYHQQTRLERLTPSEKRKLQTKRR